MAIDKLGDESRRKKAREENLKFDKLDRDWTCKSLNGLPIRGAVEDAIVLSGGLSRVYAAMDAHVSSSAVQAAGCQALDTICTQVNQTRIFSTGGLWRAYVAMSTHPADERVQAAGLSVIGSLGAHNESQAGDIVGNFGLDYVYEAIFRHPTAGTVLEKACWCLAALVHESMDEHALTQVVASGGLEFMFAAMDACPGHDIIAVAVHKSVWKAIWNLATVHANLAAIVSSGGLDRLYASMATHPKAMDVQSHGMLVLLNLSALPANFSVMKAGRKAAACLAHAMAGHARDCQTCDIMKGARKLLARLKSP